MLYASNNLKKSSANYLFNGIITVMVAAVAKIKLALAQGYSGVNLTHHRTQ